MACHCQVTTTFRILSTFDFPYFSLQEFFMALGYPRENEVVNGLKIVPYNQSNTVQTVSKKMAPFLWYALSSSNINQFSKFFHCQNQDKICNTTITKDPTTPQVCRYTTL